MKNVLKLFSLIIMILAVSTLTSCKKYECDTDDWNKAINELSNCEITLTVKNGDEEVKQKYMFYNNIICIVHDEGEYHDYVVEDTFYKKYVDKWRGSVNDYSSNPISFFKKYTKSSFDFGWYSYDSNDFTYKRTASYLLYGTTIVHVLTSVKIVNSHIEQILVKEGPTDYLFEISKIGKTFFVLPSALKDVIENK